MKDTKQMVKFILVGVLAVASGIAAYIYRDDQLIVDLLTIPPVHRHHRLHHQLDRRTDAVRTLAFLIGAFPDYARCMRSCPGACR